MNRKPVNGSKTKELAVRANRDDADTNSTDSFDMNDFKTSTLNKKYSVPIHKNKADLMAELNNINIMGDESDIEPSNEQASKADTNRLNANMSVGISDRSSSKVTNLSLNTTHSSDVQSNGELASVKHERILAWAQSQSQSLSMCVASILSDHDYLSQENLIGIITGNEEIETQKLEEIREKLKNEKDSTVIDSQETIFYEKDTNYDKMQENCEILPPNEIDDLTAILNKLRTSERLQRRILYKALLEKITLKLQKDGDENRSNDKSVESAAKQTTNRNESNDTPDFSSNHSEPLEHYGGVRFSAPTSGEEAKESEDDCKLDELKHGLDVVKDITTRMSVDAEKMRGRLVNIEKQSETERNDVIEKLRENLGLLIGDMANELTKLALKLNPKVYIENNKANIQKVADKKNKSRSVSDSSDESNVNDHLLTPRKVKRRRKKARGAVSASGSTSSSSSSDERSVNKEKRSKPMSDEPFVMTQDVDELMNCGTSNSANESLTKENDFSGFADQVDDIEIGIKTEVMLNSESLSQRSSTNEKSPSQIQVKTGTTNDNSVVNENKTSQNTSKETDPVNMSAITILNRSSSSTSLSENQDVDDDAVDEDEDDDEIRKLCDLTTCKRGPQTNVTALARGHGMVDPKKTTKKAPKEDAVAKFLANSDDTENLPESEDEKPEREEYTEEQYLQEQNLKYKQQLLEDSSESEPNYDDSDNDAVEMNGKDFILDSSDDEKSSSESDGSFVEKFLKADSKGSDQKSPNEKTQKSDKETTKESKSDDSKETSPGTKEISPKRRHVQFERFDDGLSDSDIEFDDESASVSLSEAPRKKQSTVGKNVFSNIDKEPHVVIPSDDDEDMSDGETKKKPTRKPTTEPDSSGNSEIVDSSMFKANKKVYNPQQLQRIMQSNRNKQSTSRVSPVISLSSDDDIETESTSADKKDEDDDEEKEKRVTRKLLRPDQLADDTKQAQREEQERIKRLDKKNERLSQFIESQRLSQEDTESQDENLTEVVLDITKKDERVVVHPEITKHLKPHQVEGIKFMYDCCYGSVDNLEKFPGSGCILAHCMGLGKTLQLITLLHTVICNPQLKTDKVLVICPKSTVMNWKDEIERWLSPIKNTRKLKLYHFAEGSDMTTKLNTLRGWSQCGKDNKQAGCLLLGYEAFRVLVFYHNSKKSKQNYTETELEKIRKSIHKYLLDPGADLVVCDEGHMIKNQKSTTSMAVNKIITKRRIVLTGTPIQNNLKEYYSMVNFIKPSFLGTEKEFANLYVNPIKNGQHKDSSKSEIKYMKQRSYVLHKKLSRFVQRKEAALLKSFLPDKYEYVLFIPMTEIQTSLYEFFLENRPNQDQKGKSLIPDYTVLRKIWTHPKVLENAYLNAIQNKTKVKPATTPVANMNDSDDDQPDDVFDSQTGQMSVTSDWWRSHLSKEDLETILPSNKLKIVFEILQQCRNNKEKCLIFSAFVAVLDVVEFFMRLINDQEKEGNKPGLENFRGPFVYGQDYYRLDGKTAKNQRHSMITSFNEPKNERTRVFLISAKAGGQGINLIGANRVILLDTSWNPSNDQQNIFRVFRLGQKRICYIYRLLSMGTMEEKVYSRSVTKQAMSCRVMDEQQIDRHYNMAELTELYILTKPSMTERPTPNLPKDDLLKFLLMKFPHMVYKYHEHDSLLENKGEEELSEQEKNDAWAAYEADVKRKNETNMGPYNNAFGSMLPNYSSALGTYANSLFNNYNNLSGVSGLNYPYNMYSQYPYSNDYSFSDYTSFYNNLMTMGRPMSNYNQTSPNLLSPNHPTTVSSPPPPIMNMNNFSGSRNWMQPNASSSNYANSLLSSLSSPSSKNYHSYLNNLYNALGTNNAPASASASSASNVNASTSKTPPLPLGNDFNPLAYLQKQNLLNLTNSSSSTSPQPSTSSGGQQGPNALRNPMLTKELTLPRNPTLPTAKEPFNLPIPTSVITKSTTSTSSTLSSIVSSSAVANELNKSNSKSPDLIITSSVDKASTKTSKSTADNQLIIKDVRTINNESRDSPDTTATNQLHNRTNSDKDKASTSSTVSNGVSSSTLAENLKKANRAPNVVTPISTNMGIVYPPSKPTQTASTSKAELSSTILTPVNAKAAKDKEPLRKPTPTPSSNKTSNQPMPAIIRKPNQSNARPNDPSNDAVAAINKNKALTVTARSVALASKTPTVADVNNSITLSPIPISSTPKFGGVSIVKTNTSNQSRTQSPISKPNVSSPVPTALTKVNINHGQTTITKSPTTAIKTNGLGTRSAIATANALKVSTAIPKIAGASTVNTSATRTLANNLNVSPKIVVQGRSSQAYKPIIAQTKAQAQAQAQAQNNSAFQVKRVISKPTPASTQQASSSAIANKYSRFGLEITRKRTAAEAVSIEQPKRPRPRTTLNSATSASKAQNPLQGIRVSPRPVSQPLNSQIKPVEIVELE